MENDNLAWWDKYRCWHVFYIDIDIETISINDVRKCFWLFCLRLVENKLLQKPFDVRVGD